MERAGWFSGLLSAVKLYQSVSISGPSATSKPIERQLSSMRCQVRITGWMPPRPRPRPGSVTSSASSARRAASLASAGSARRAPRACSTRCLAALNFAPNALRDSAGTDLRAACSAVSSPAFPRTRALAFSRDAASPAALNAASARETMPSRSCNLVGEAGLDLARDLHERRLAGDRENGQHLAVDVECRDLMPRYYLHYD